jgi:hypothetical protein
MDTDLAGLVGRVDEAFQRSRDRLRNLRQQPMTDHRRRQERLALFERACDGLKELWAPRLEAVKQRLEEKLKVSVMAQSGRRQASLGFTASLARISLAFTAMTDLDVRSMVLACSLDIVPTLTAFPCKDRLEQALENVNPQAMGEWIDHRLVDCVETYLSLYENEYNLSGQIVEDPIAHVRFPKHAAATTLENRGSTLYFMSQETRQEYEGKAGKRSPGLQDA